MMEILSSKEERVEIKWNLSRYENYLKRNFDKRFFWIKPSHIINDERKKISLTTLTVKLGQLDEKKKFTLKFLSWTFICIEKSFEHLS